MKRSSTIVAALLWFPALLADGSEGPRVDFARDVKPILERSCVKCHGTEKQKGSVRFDHRDGALGAGDSGNRAVVPGRADQSELLRRIDATDDSERMPLDTEPLRPEERRILRHWIEEGAAPAGAGRWS